VLEAWMKMAKRGETLDMAEAPSEAFDRREVMVLTGETRISAIISNLDLVSPPSLKLSSPENQEARVSPAQHHQKPAAGREVNRTGAQF
jgi:hypothetical protein